MRKLSARGDVPAKLKEAETGALAIIKAAVASGKETLPFQNRIYASDEVREALDGMHHGKCAYCEVKIVPVAVPNVEHFRPKGAYVNEVTRKQIKPGYYWLGYEWSNLLLACPTCNGRSRKGNRFPLVEEAERITSHEGDINSERPILIDPSLENPLEYIVFNGPVARGIDPAGRGALVIDILGLNDENLVDDRNDVLELLEDVMDSYMQATTEDLKDRLFRRLIRMKSERGQYSVCVKFYLDTNRRFLALASARGL